MCSPSPSGPAVLDTPRARHRRRISPMQSTDYPRLRLVHGGETSESTLSETGEAEVLRDAADAFAEWVSRLPTSSEWRGAFSRVSSLDRVGARVAGHLLPGRRQ